MRLIRKRIGVLLAVVLTACAAPGPWEAPAGQYADYRDYIAKLSQSVLRDRMPETPAASLSGCIADLVIDQIAPADLRVLDAAARGEKTAPAPLVKEAVARSDAVLAGTEADLREKMLPFCPDLISAYGHYLDRSSSSSSVTGEPQTFKDFMQADFENSYTKLVPLGMAPDDPEQRHRMAVCLSDLVIANITPEQLSRLDAVIGRRSAGDTSLWAEIDRQILPLKERMDRGDYTALEPYCPNEIPLFRKYGGL
jgi:hypothetical protein